MSKPRNKNALKHGANAREVMFWSENYEDYEVLRTELYLEFSPSGSTEEHLVQTLLDLRWRRRRLDCHEQITIQKRLDKIREENETSRHIENLRSFASEFNEAASAEKVEAMTRTSDLRFTLTSAYLLDTALLQDSHKRPFVRQRKQFLQIGTGQD